MILIYLQFSLLFQLNNKAIWITRYSLNNKTTLNELVKFSIKNKITDVFIQVRGRGDAYYRSKIEANKKSDLYHYNLIDLIGKLKANGIRSHAWINVCLLASSTEQLSKEKQHILNSNKNWIDYTNDSKAYWEIIKSDNDLKTLSIEGLFVLPIFPNLLNYYQQIISELLLNYEFDGIHLDYFRMADGKSGYHPKLRRLFYEETGIHIHPNSPAEIELNWKKFIADKFTEFLLQLKVEGHYLYSVAVKPDPDDAFLNFGQNWVDWIKENIVNFVVPMNYSANFDSFNNHLEHYETMNLDKIWVGIATYNKKLSDLKKNIQQLERNNYHYSIFSFDDLHKKNILQLVD